MIYSDRQHNVSISELTKLKAELEVLLSERGAGKTWLHDVGVDALRSQISDMESEIQEYEALKSGQIMFSGISSLAELPRMLIQARIANGLNQTEFAEQLGMKPQQIQRYEATNYMGASLSRLIQAADALGIKISESFETKSRTSTGAIFSWDNMSNVAWSRLPLKEMKKRKWFDVLPGQSIVDAARDFFVMAAGPQFVSAMHRKKIHSGNAPNEYALLAWQARVLEVARTWQADASVKPFKLDDTWFNKLASLTRQVDGPAQVRKVLAEHGIVLVIERHLPGTYLDGAAMLMDSGNPLIALTLRHDRLDNFWFVLFHELGHVFLHLWSGLKFDFFDEEDDDDSDTDNLEREADRFALDNLIPPELWDQCLSRFALTERAVQIDAEKLGVGEAIVAGRLRRERNNYTIFNELIGANSVRQFFWGD